MGEKKELLDQDERVVEIELERLRGFVNHPFKVQADSQMIELQESIKKYGILNPLIVRPRQDGTYEIISGHRRKFAAEKIGYRKVPVIIRVLKDDEAVVSMVDSNLQREMISPSEKAFAYKMKYEAIKRKAGRRKCGQVDHNLGKKSIELIGEECGDSPKQVQRYIKITELIPEMLEKVDDGSMGFTPAVQLSFLKKKEQKEMLDAMEFAQCTPSLSQALRIKKLSADGKLTVRDMEDILSEIKQKEIDRVVFKTEQLDTDGQHDESILQELKQITASQANIDIISRYERREEMQEYLITAKVLGTGLSVILLLVGVMNFVNTMVVNVNTRRYELAVLESIGMTKRQIKRMLFMEGFYYWGVSLSLAVTIGTAIFILLYMIFSKVAYYAVFSYPFIPLVLVSGLVLLICLIVPIWVYKTDVNIPVVERLRLTE